MKNLIIGFIVGFIVASAMVAKASSFGGEYVWNKVFDSATNTISITGE